jgi:hypothetical protein
VTPITGFSGVLRDVSARLGTHVLEQARPLSHAGGSGVLAPQTRTQADAFTDWVNSITIGWGPFSKFSGPAATIVGLIALGALLYGTGELIIGLAKGGWQSHGRSDTIIEGRHQLQRGIVILVGIPLLFGAIIAIYQLAK